MTTKRRTTIISVSIIALLLLYYFCIMLPENRRMRKAGKLFSQFQLVSDFFQPLGSQEVKLPEDILSSSGEPLLSWRVSYLLDLSNKDFFMNDVTVKAYLNWDSIGSVDTTKPWNDKSNEFFLNSRPFFYFYPFYLEPECGNKTCLLRIKEIHEKIRSGTIQAGEEEKAYLVFVDPKYAVPWTKPQDVSWKDLASGKVQLFTAVRIRYYNVQGIQCILDKAPETLEEWREFCGVDD